MTPPVPLRERLALIVIADPDAAPPGQSVVEAVHAALRGGAPAIQLRAKRLSARDTVELARELLPAIRRAGALFFVNDRVDVALAVGADGAHLGDDDLPLPAARAITPAGFLLGRSVDTPDEARLAAAEGADYVGAGPVYTTISKSGLGPPLGSRGIAKVTRATPLPVVGIGGIDAANAAAVLAAGVAGVAVIRAVIGAPDPESATRALLRAVRESRGSANP